jgi:hypothetical protein
VGRRAGRVAVEEERSLTPAGTRTPVVQHVARCHIDRAIPAITRVPDIINYLIHKPMSDLKNHWEILLAVKAV